MSSSVGNSAELSALRTLRASLEAIRLLTEGLKNDVTTLGENYGGLEKRAERIEEAAKAVGNVTTGAGDDGRIQGRGGWEGVLNSMENRKKTVLETVWVDRTLSTASLDTFEAELRACSVLLEDWL
jgi:hypothetical protein